MFLYKTGVYSIGPFQLWQRSSACKNHNCIHRINHLNRTTMLANRMVYVGYPFGNLFFAEWISLTLGKVMQ
jgi:hypothetical protein